MPAKLTSVFGHAEAEYTIKKSRFIASLQEVHDEAHGGQPSGRVHRFVGGVVQAVGLLR